MELEELDRVIRQEKEMKAISLILKKYMFIYKEMPRNI